MAKKATTKKTSKKATARKATAKNAPAKKSPTEPAADKAKPTSANGKKLSAIDATAKVLSDAGQAMNCGNLIEAMAAKKLWISPGGKTPDRTLYSAILREIGTKGKDARFKKPERGR